jgi:tetratricopeptide (TPR) repeat protein
LVLGNVGEARFYRGDLAGAESRYRQALDSARQIGDTDAEANQLNDIAILLEARRDLAGAKNSFEQALALWRDNNVPGSASAMAGLGDVQLAQGDVDAARKAQEEALAAREKLGEKESIAESQLALAHVSLEEGRAAEAEPIIRKAAGEFQAENIPDLESVANALLARSFVAQGKLAVAKKAKQRAVALSRKSQEPLIRISVTITAACVESAVAEQVRSPRASPTAAAKELRGALREARAFGFLGLELESRLALAEPESDSARGKMRNEQLTLLAADARARGYGLIARKAAAAW